MHHWKLRICAALISVTLGTVFASTIPSIDFSGNSDYSNHNPPTSGLFRDWIDGGSINRGYDVGFTWNTALNFGFNAGSAGASAITLYDTNPTTAIPTSFSGNISLTADVLVDDWNDTNQPGLVAYFNEGAGQGGIALLLSRHRSSHSLLLQKVGQTGILTGGSNDLAFLALPDGSIDTDTWYRLVLDGIVSGNTLQLTGQLFHHELPGNPNSSVASQIGNNLVYSGNLAALGISSSGEVGMAFRTVSGHASASITNFAGVSGDAVAQTAAVPEPGTMFLVGCALVLAGCWRRRPRLLACAIRRD